MAYDQNPYVRPIQMPQAYQFDPYGNPAAGAALQPGAYNPLPDLYAMSTGLFAGGGAPAPSYTLPHAGASHPGGGGGYAGQPAASTQGGYPSDLPPIGQDGMTPWVAAAFGGAAGTPGANGRMPASFRLPAGPGGDPNGNDLAGGVPGYANRDYLPYGGSLVPGFNMTRDRVDYGYYSDAAGDHGGNSGGEGHDFGQ